MAKSMTPKPRTKAAPKTAKALRKPRTRKPKGAADDSEFAAGPAFDDTPLPTGKELKAHIDNLASLHSELAIIRGHVGAAVKNAETDKNIDRWCASLVVKLKRIEPDKREAKIKMLRSMFLMMGWGEQANLPFEQERGASPST